MILAHIHNLGWIIGVFCWIVFVLWLVLRDPTWDKERETRRPRDD